MVKDHRIHFKFTMTDTNHNQQKKAENIRKKWTLATIGLSALSLIVMAAIMIAVVISTKEHGERSMIARTGNSRDTKKAWQNFLSGLCLLS